MSHSIDEYYSVYRETRRKARKQRACSACAEPILPGNTYFDICAIQGREKPECLARCERCQAIHKHLRSLEPGEMWPAERLDCGEEYREHWGKEPPEHIAALAFALPGDPLPQAQDSK